MSNLKCVRRLDNFKKECLIQQYIVLHTSHKEKFLSASLCSSYVLIDAMINVTHGKMNPRLPNYDLPQHK